MKKILSYVVTAFVASVVTVLVCNARHEKKVRLYENYIHTSEELLYEVEEMCNYHNIDWGDTVCEGWNWSNYCDAREELGLNYLEHYSKVK
jgi:hypothetical protein